MAFLASILTPYGAAVAFHQVARIEGNLADPFIAVLVHSWPTKEDCEAHGRNGATCVWPIPVPVTALLSGGSTLTELCESAIVAFEDPANPFYGADTVPDVTDLETAKAYQRAMVKQARAMLDRADVELDGFALQVAGSSRQDVFEALFVMTARGEASRDWRCADNVMRSLGVDQLLEAATTAVDRRQGLIETSAGLFDDIDDAATVETVRAVVWPT